MATSNQIIIPARTSKTVRITILSGLEDLAPYTFTMTVKRSSSLPTVTFTVDGYVDGDDILFDISYEDSNVRAGGYKYDVIGDDGSKRIPICDGSLIIELWPSSIVE